MRLAGHIAAVIGLIVWGAILFLLMSAGPAGEARIVLAMVMCTVLIVGAISGIRQRRPAADDRVPCPFCAEGIKPEAILCPFCRSPLTDTGTERLRYRE